MPKTVTTRVPAEAMRSKKFLGKTVIALPQPLVTQALSEMSSNYGDSPSTRILFLLISLFHHKEVYPAIFEFITFRLTHLRLHLFGNCMASHD